MKVNYNDLAQEYMQHRQINPEVLKSLIQVCELDSSSKVLEIGCGTGNYSIALGERTGCSNCGIDPSEQMLAEAKARNSNVDFQRGHGGQVPHPDSNFDLVFSVDVIHHVGDHSAYFHEGHRVLGQGGTICTVTDSEEIIRGRSPLSTYFPETVEVELHRYPRIIDLQNKMVKAGFQNIRETKVQFTYTISDIQRYRDKAFSCLHLISSEAFERGIQSMEDDLQAGSISGCSRYLLLWGTKEG